jgi:hypothetical protein
MKLTRYISLSLFLVCAMTFGQYHAIERVQINESDVPEEVVRAQRLEFSDGFVTGWKFHMREDTVDDDTSYFMASFKKDGRLGNYSYYSKEGELLAYLLHINSGDLPGNIQESAKNSLQGSYIKSAELIDLENPKRQLYRVRLNSDGQLKYLYYDMYGNIIDRYKLPAQIFAFI